MIRALSVRGEVAVIGLGRSGRAASMLLRRHGAAVYASDAGAGESARAVAGELNELGIDASTGGHDLERIGRAGLVVVSPGVPPGAAPLAAALAKGVPIVSELEVALPFLTRTRYLAVTGTNGKTTVTALIDHLLRSLGLQSAAAGNIGTPLCDIALMEVPPSWIALEVSSFQLHHTTSLDPAVGVLTNLTPDHLDRYDSLEAYYSDKMRLFANAGAESTWVTNADDAEVERRTASVVGSHARFSMRDPGAEARFGAATGMCWLLGTEFIARSGIPLMGDHNVANVLAAVLAVALADPSHRSAAARARLADGVRTFRGMPHRLELVTDRDGVQWINDSKATNVSSARVAIDGMTRPAVVLLGGRHKGEPYTALIDGLRMHARTVIAFGEAAPLVEADLGGHVPLERLGSSFEEVIEHARAAARPGDAVLLSPACSSFDMFANYEERGAAFRRLARGT